MLILTMWQAVGKRHGARIRMTMEKQSFVGTVAAIAAFVSLTGMFVGGLSATAACPIEEQADAAAPVLLVHVSGVKKIEGNLRAQIYSDNAEEWLEKGKKLVRVEVPVRDHSQDMCVPLPHQGSFALVVLHDRNANGKADVFSEGFGFSNNPELGLGKPDHEKVIFAAGSGTTTMDVSMNYLLSGSDEKKKHHRARRR
ncbi:uncharacterized protein (DUF2141 family) [Eilatimonas milleporae]|uniref:Uncharacterized protein (DUF2141 family) n=2 Tax=Eilatimonas milleporae TaxID=911205 RepID=A0A3M0C4X9_9PROT|nr:uncharacterized protein (DUF2141 family) [Eilatimonas milleporae]